MQQKIIFLRPLGSHASPILSHTLFGATCWAMATLGQDVGAMLQGFDAGGPRFAFTNTYPYLRTKDNVRLLLLPRPPFRVPPGTIQAHPEVSIIDRVDWAKKLQKASFVSPGIAEKLRDGTWDIDELFAQVLEKQVKVHHSTFWLSAEIKSIWDNRPKKPWQQVPVQHNSVDRVSGATADGLLFQQSETFYDWSRAGLWFGVWADDAIWPTVHAALRFVQDTGLGAKRSVGKGHFAFSKPVPWSHYFPAAPNHQRFINLSHYIPATPNETEPLSYTLDVIRQKAENRYPQGAQRVYMATLRAFEPGGLFAALVAEEHLYGKLLPLGDLGGHMVYYSGLTLPLWGVWEV